MTYGWSTMTRLRRVWPGIKLRRRCLVDARRTFLDRVYGQHILYITSASISAVSFAAEKKKSALRKLFQVFAAKPSWDLVLQQGRLVSSSRRDSTMRILSLRQMDDTQSIFELQRRLNWQPKTSKTGIVLFPQNKIFVHLQNDPHNSLKNWLGTLDLVVEALR